MQCRGQASARLPTIIGCQKVLKWPLWPKWLLGSSMKTMSARDAKNGFGLLLDTARAEPVTIEKHGRPVVVVLSKEEYDRLKGLKDRARERGRD